MFHVPASEIRIKHQLISTAGPSAVPLEFKVQNLFFDRVVYQHWHCHKLLQNCTHIFLPQSKNTGAAFIELVTSIYNYDWYPVVVCLYRPENYSNNFWRIYRIILIISVGFIVYFFALFYYGYVVATSWKIIETKIFCYELTYRSGHLRPYAYTIFLVRASEIMPN